MPSEILQNIFLYCLISLAYFRLLLSHVHVQPPVSGPPPGPRIRIRLREVSAYRRVYIVPKQVLKCRYVGKKNLWISQPRSQGLFPQAREKTMGTRLMDQCMLLWFPDQISDTLSRVFESSSLPWQLANSETEEQDMVWNCFASLIFKEKNFRATGLKKN